MARRKRKQTKKRTRKQRRGGAGRLPGIAMPVLLVAAAILIFAVWRWYGNASPPDSGKPKIVFVLDDIGHHRDFESELVALGSDVTYAVLPHLRHSRHFADLSRKTGAEVILHLPLETLDGTIPGPGLITRAMPRDQVIDVLTRNLDSVPRHVGVNNHMGSRGSADVSLMRTILGELENRNLFYLDSQTTPDTAAAVAGRELGIPVLRRDVFLDNVDARGPIRNQVERLANTSMKQGYAVGIGHYRRNTLEVLMEAIPRLKQEGFEITTLAKLAKKR